MIGEMRCRRHHAPGVARRADAAPLAGKRDQEVVPALPAAGAGKTVGQEAALQVTAELALHILRHRFVVIMAFAALGEPGLEVFLDAAIEHALARTARPIPRRCARSGPEVDLHTCLPLPRVAALGLRVGGTVWRALLATRTKSRG